MIVGTKDVSPEEVRKHCRSVTALTSFCVELVPRLFRHDERIVSNQKYLVALMVRDLKSIPYETRRNLYEGLLEGVAITGVANEVYDIDYLMSQIDIDKLAMFVNKGEVR